MTNRPMQSGSDWVEHCAIWAWASPRGENRRIDVLCTENVEDRLGSEEQVLRYDPAMAASPYRLGVGL